MKKKLAFFYVLILSTSVFFFLDHITKPKTSALELLSPLATTPEQAVASSATNSLVFSAGLTDAVETALIGTQGTYGIFIKNLKTGETYVRNEQRSFPTASLYKLWTMAVVYEHLAQGTLKKDQVLSDSVQSLNKRFQIASDAAEMKEGQITYSVEDALNRMITISHNYAALLLTGKVRITSLNGFLKSHGLLNSKTGDPPKTNALDMAFFFEKLYKGEIVNKEASEEMLTLLKKQQLNDRIPKYLPKEIQVAHKTGELYGFKHDAGIVYTKQGDYIIVVLTESINSIQAAERIANISKNVYAHFTQAPHN